MVVKKKQFSIWEEIKDTPNNEEGIIEKISILSPMLSYISSVNTMEIYNKRKENSLDTIKERDFDNVFIELLILEMFLVDCIFNFANIKNKAKYRQILLQETISVLELIVSERELSSEFDESEFTNKLNKRVREYTRLNNSKSLEDLFNQDFFESFRTKIGDLLILHKNNSLLIDFQKEIIKSVKALELDKLFNIYEEHNKGNSSKTKN